MTSNSSLEKSLSIRNAMSKELSSVFETEFPFGLNRVATSRRDRIYNDETTLLSMIHSSVQEDRSLQNSVLIFQDIHNRNIERINKLEEELKTIKNGRRKERLDIQKSKRKPISTRTGGYSQARTRLDMDYVLSVYRKSAESSSALNSRKFYGRRVFITDGTYLQLQDTAAIKEKFNNSVRNGYPRGLLSGIIDQSSGLVVDFTLDSDKKSELELFGSMIKNIPHGSLLLADDLYNCFAIFALLQNQGVDIIVPGKRQRKYKVIKKIADGDEIVGISLDTSKSTISKKFNIQNRSLQLRRIEVKDPNEDRSMVMYTTIIDEGITKLEIYLKYFTRWDIEISCNS